MEFFGTGLSRVIGQEFIRIPIGVAGLDDEIFVELDSLLWNYVVYLPPGSFTLDSQCLVLDPDDVDPDEELPKGARDAGYREGLGIDDIRSIRENARLQGKHLTNDEMLEAFAHYLQNDAFIEYS